MAMGNAAVAQDDRVLVIERMFDAPRDLVWKMFADPQHMVAWMGPRKYPAASRSHFYFHVVTAYDILRHNGLDIGKRDYLAHVRRFIHERD